MINGDINKFRYNHARGYGVCGGLLSHNFFVDNTCQICIF